MVHVVQQPNGGGKVQEQLVQEGESRLRRKYTHDVRTEDAIILDPRHSIPLNRHYCQSTAKRILAGESVGQGGVNQGCRSREAAHPPATSRSVVGIVCIFNMDEKGQNLG